MSYTVGNENNPSHPFGRSVLAIDANGQARLEHHARGGGHTAFTGTMAPGVADRLWAALERARFPTAPTQVMTPGSTVRILSVEPPGGKKQVAHIEWHAGSQFAGYDEAFQLLDGMIRQLSGNTVERTPAPDAELVTGVQAAT